jgi:hypothetical protein
MEVGVEAEGEIYDNEGEVKRKQKMHSKQPACYGAMA